MTVYASQSDRSSGERVTVEDLASTDRNAIVGGPFGSNLVSRDYVASGVPVIRGQNMGDRWIGGDFAFVSEAKANELSANIARPGDIVFTQRGTLGQVALVPVGDFDEYVVSQSQMKLTVDPTKADPLYLYYEFSSPNQQHYVRVNAIQSGVPHTNLGILRSTPVCLPPLDEQRAIAGVLGALDDKIEQNRRTSQVLERLARAIFFAWFIDFEPVKAKAAGATAFPSMPRAVFDTLPTEFEDSELGPMPQGWEVKALGDVIDLFDSKRIPLSRRQREERPGEYRYYGAAGIVDYVDGFLFDGEYVLIGEDGTVYSDGDRPMVQYVWGQFWVNNHAHVVTGSAGFSTEHIRVLLDYVNIRPFITGAVQPKLNQRNLKSVPITVADDATIEAFNALIDPLFALTRQLSDESRKLAELRDYLLPKLLSGQIRVDHAEREVQEVA